MNPQGKDPEVISPNAVATAQPKDVTGPLPVTYFRGVPPDDKLNRMYGFARAICNAAFISPVVRGDEASVFYLVSMAEDMGLQWTHGLRSIYPMVRRGRNGEPDQIRAGIQGDIAQALLQKAKFKIKIKASDDKIATVWMQRPDETMEFEDSFTIEEAQRFGLLDKPNWQYRRDMLRWRAIMRVARVVAADVLGGMYLPDELDAEFGVSTPSESQAAPENGTQFKVGRKSAKTSANADQQAPSGVFSEPQPEGEGVSIQRAESPSSPVIQTPDKPPFDPTPESEPPLLKIVPSPGSAKPSASPVLVTVKGIPDAKVNDYLRGFLNVTKVPKTHPNMAAAVEYLASLDPLLVLRDPYALGVDLRDWMNGEPFWGEKLSPADLRAWLRVIARGGQKLGGKFRDAAMGDGQPSKLVAEWEEAGMDLDSCTPEDIESALQLLAPSGPHSPAEALAAAHGDEVPNPFKGLRG